MRGLMRLEREGGVEVWQRSVDAAKAALQNLLSMGGEDRLLVIYDDSLERIAKAFFEAGQQLGSAQLLSFFPDLEDRATCLGRLVQNLESYGPTVAVTAFRDLPGETTFRIAALETLAEFGLRVGHMPGVRYEWLVEGPLALTHEEYQDLAAKARALMERLESVRRLHIANPDGTELSCIVEGRQWRSDCVPGASWMINLPVGEIYIAPIERSAEGKVVVRGTIGGVGVPKAPVVIEVKNGQMVSVSSEDEEFRRKVQIVLTVDEGARWLGEVGIGLNPRASPFADKMLEAEKAAGTMHVAFGYNRLFGGRIRSKMHNDMVLLEPTLEADGEEILKDGKLRL